MHHDTLFRMLLAEHAALAAGTYFSDEVRLADGSIYLTSRLIPDEVFNFGVPVGPGSVPLIRAEAARRDRPPALMLPSAEAVERVLGGVAPAAIHPAAWMWAEPEPARHAEAVREAAGPAVEVRRMDDARPGADFIVAFVEAHAEPVVRDYVRDTYAAALAAASPAAGISAEHFILWEAGEPAACASLYRHGGTAGLYNVATRADRTRRGHGRRVAAATLARAAEVGCGRVILQCSTEPPLLALYEGLGFRTVCSPVLVVL